jgi:hypothetical protein
VEDKIKHMFPDLKPTNMPTIVWLSDDTDDKTNRKIDGTIMKNEQVGIALQRYNCFKVDVLGMPDGDLKTAYQKETPGFYFFDPAAKYLNKVTGKRATSLSMFSKLMEHTWDESFTVRLKVFSKQMKEILDQLDKYEVRKQGVDRNRAKLEERPNPSLAKKVEMEDAELQKFKEEIEAAEKEIVEGCALRPEFVPEASGDSR